jgi:hypothetical protein
MNAYQAKQLARRQRLERGAERAQERAKAHHQAAHEAVAYIPLGQPILVGHPSETPHRRALERSHRHMDQFCEEFDRAKDLKHAAAQVGKGGISSDDPDAIDKLKAKLAGLEHDRETMKQLNRYWHKHGTMKGAPGVSDERAAELDWQIPARYSWERQPFPGYALKNLGANIRRIRDRIARLEIDRTSVGTSELATGPGYRVVADADDNRIHFIFDEKPPREICKMMRRRGWRWSPSRKAWVRHLTDTGRAAVSWTTAELVEMGGTD